MTEIEVPCPTCAGTGESTCDDRHAGTNMDTCRTCGGRRTIPARPGESRETSWPWAVPEAAHARLAEEAGKVRLAGAISILEERDAVAQIGGGDDEGLVVVGLRLALERRHVVETRDAPQAPSSTPGEVERLLDALVWAAQEHAWTNADGAADWGRVDFEAAWAEIAAARAALLSHISTVRGSESPASDSLAALSQAAEPGMLTLSPQKYDDWGMIRTTRPGSDGFCWPIFRTVILDDDAEQSTARAERRQPKIVKANSDFLIRLWNDYRSGRLVERSAPDATTPTDRSA